MNSIRFVLLFAMSIVAPAVTLEACPTCGGPGNPDAQDTGPSLFLSLGAANYGESAGDLTFDSSTPEPMLFTPAALKFNASRPDVNVITTNVVGMLMTTDYLAEVSAVITSNVFYSYFTNLGTIYIYTNWSYDVEAVTNTNAVVTVTIVTNPIILQVQAPQAIADVPTPPSANGYTVNFYYPSSVIGTNADGTCQLAGSPFVSWLVTNASDSGTFEMQVSEYGVSPDYGLMKQWTYDYSTNTGTWSVQPLGGIFHENTTITNLSATVYQIIYTGQSPSGSVVRQTKKTYETLSWPDCTQVVLVTNAVGSDSAPEITTYTYWDPATFNAGSTVLPETVTYPDGSQEYYASYNANGLPTDIYSTFEDNAQGRHTYYDYDPGNAGLSGSGDDGSLNSTVPRLVIEYENGSEVSRRYTVFPSAGVRLDIQCTAPGAAWNDPRNLVTTNLFYTSGPDQYALKSVIQPNDIMSIYNYATNELYETNAVVTGQPDSTYSYIVEGTSNQTVLNQWGYMVSRASWDIQSGILLSRDICGNFDGYGRPQQVTRLDGTTEYTQYACCGLDNTINRDGLITQYLYDSATRQVGYDKIYGSTPITYTNVLDAAGDTLQSIRIGSDNSTITMSQAAYDLAGELIARTNALSGVTTFIRTNDPNTGGLIRTTIYPDGGIVTNFYYADGSLKESDGTGVHGKAYEYGVDYCDVTGDYEPYTKETDLNADGSQNSEWQETFTDIASRPIETRYADWSYSQSFYNSKGQLWKTTDPDGITILHQYNGKGELAYTAIDMNRNDTIDFDGTDRIAWTTNDVTMDHGMDVCRTRTYVWDQDGVDSSAPVSTQEASTDGLNTWQTTYRDANTPVTTHSQTVYGISGSRTVTTTAPDDSYTISAYSYGRLVSVTRYDSTSAQISGTTYAYDAHGRQYQVTDARKGTTTYGYNNADEVNSLTTPAPGGGQSPETTVTYYDKMLRATNVVQPDDTSVTSIYLLTGELGLQYGSRTYPVAYRYDYAGRIAAMTNWSDFAGNSGARVTTWNYDPYRGFLTSKTYDGGAAGPSYTYTYAGRLQTRTWARGITTTYGYDNAGDLQSVTYSDGTTPDVSYTYDRLGRQSTIACNGMTDTLAYNLANQLLSESYSGGVLNGLSVTNGYDSDLRRTALAGLSSGSPLISTAYGYDNASRLESVTDGNNNSALYLYVANSPLVSQITFKQNGNERMTTTKQYDYLNRLTQISSQPSGAGVPPVVFTYTYNTANQRSKDVLADESYWIYGYDSLGQVTSAHKYFYDGTPVPAQQFDYGFDDIGNRKQTLAGGDQTGGNQRLADYSVNNLNQITGRDYPGTNDIIGAALATNSVAVNGQTAWRKWEYFWATVKTNNASSAQWLGVTVASGGHANTGNLFFPKTPEQFGYDADGNLTSDGRWTYGWDAENRLTSLTANTSAGPQYTITFVYDAKGRRIQKTVATNGVTIYTDDFLYDGWNLLATLNSSLSLLNSFMWGNDLSGTAQGAGGVGGLLEVSCYGAQTTNCFPAFDGNGNVMALVNAADGTLAAEYDYGPFGEPIRQTGPLAKANPFHLSTKYQDDESDLIYYGYRAYNPSTGCWPNRDPLGERWAINLYVFVYNSVTEFIDRDGRLGVGTGPDSAPLGPQADTPSAEKSPWPDPDWEQCPTSKTPCPGYKPTSNGCGPDGWKAHLVPNNPFLIGNFEKACNQHDICYGTCGTEKDCCDKALLHNLQLSCQLKYSWNSLDPPPPNLEALCKACYALAQTYYEAVSKAGGSAFDAAQKTACNCCGSEKKSQTPATSCGATGCSH